MKRLKLDENQKKWGKTIFLSLGGVVILCFLLSESAAIGSFLGKLSDILKPFVYGMVFAYLLCPMYNFLMRKFLVGLEAREKPLKNAIGVSKVLSSTITMLAFCAIIVGVVWMIIPSLISSLGTLGENISETARKTSKWATENAEKIPAFQKALQSWVENLGTHITNLVHDKLLPQYDSIAATVSAGLMGVLEFFKNFFVGVIICVYFLNSKEIFAAQCKKLALVILNEERAKGLLNGARYTNLQFGKFINGKLIDSLIIGIICFIFMTIFRWDYALLISCIIGVTNIIPFFGPFIGAIPSILLLLIVDPMQALYFTIFILVLQQVDGSIIGPKILGETTGLSSFWVMFAILVGGGLFGFAGMILGIPIFAVIYAYATKGVNKQLANKGYSIDLNDYKVDQYRHPPEKKKKNDIHI